ncbi:MAG TPA: SDR family oxidoreductase [Chitinophagaceae bacterium]|nr:SDR family oxidoreductase [Chitinophagaceae bacterium]
MGKLAQFDLTGKVIVISGGTGVLGGSWASALANAGAKIAILGRNEKKTDEKVKEIEANGGEVIAVITDVLEEKQVENAKTTILEKWGQVDGLINAAGGNIPESVVMPDQDLFSLKISDLKKALDLNLYGTVIPTQIFAAEMAKRKEGVILNVSSITGKKPLTRVMGYGMAKCAIESYTEWMAIELAQRYGDRMRINAIAPGFFLTTQNKDLLLNKDGSYADRAQKIVNGTPYGRLGKTEELDGTVIYLMSDASKFVTGETVMVDGGFNAFFGV